MTDFDIQHLLTFPFKDEEARKNFLLGMLVSLAGFILPILPVIVLLGYTVRMVRQTANGEKASLSRWDNWNSFLMDGLRVFGVQMIYSLPMLFILLAALGALLGGLALDASNSPRSEQIILLSTIAPLGLIILLIPIGLILSVATLMGALHTAVTGDFAAGFRIREWWDILRANPGGFALAYLISMMVSLVIGMIANLLLFSLIFACLFPFLLPPITTYSTFITYAAFAQAYKTGREKFAIDKQNAPS